MYNPFKIQILQILSCKMIVSNLVFNVIEFEKQGNIIIIGKENG